MTRTVDPVTRTRAPIPARDDERTVCTAPDGDAMAIRCPLRATTVPVELELEAALAVTG
jgi:hypothetical protein